MMRRKLAFPGISFFILAACSTAVQRPPAEPVSEEQPPTTERLAGCWRAGWDSEYGRQSLTYCFDANGNGTSIYIGDQEGLEETIVYSISGSELSISYPGHDGKIVISRKYNIRLSEQSVTLYDETGSRVFRLECGDVVNSDGQVSCKN